MGQTTRNSRCASGRGLRWALVLLSSTSGCMSQQLRYTTQQTVSALPDLQYQQVVDNLAKLAANPGVLPYLAVVGQGSVQVTDNGSSLVGLNSPANLLAPTSVSLGATRNITGTWSLGTITSPDKIRSMQSVYLHAISGRASGDPAFTWLKIGAQSDVPNQAAYVGHFQDVYAWVMPDGMDGLSDLTLAIMDVATKEDIGGGAFREGGPVGAMPFAPGVPRRNFQVSPVGPVFTPGKS
jgi:hypothetical protein